MTNPETPKSQPTTTPSTTPSGTLLRDFRTTLESKWKKFDDAVPPDGKSLSDNYKKAKAEYGKSIELLKTVKNDDELKSNTQVQTQLDTTIDVLNKHLKKLTQVEKQEKYNIALADMRDSLADLKWDITGKKELAEAAKLWWIAVAAAGAPWLAGEVTWTLSEWLDEMTSEIKKKWAWGMIRDFLGFDDASIVWNIRSAIETKKSAKWFDKFFAGMSLFFHKFLAKMFGIDLGKHLKSEEMEALGMKAAASTETKPVQWVKERAKEGFTDIVYSWIATVLTMKAFYEPLKTDNQFIKGYHQEESKKEELEKSRISALFSQPTIKSATYKDILQKITKVPVGYTIADMEKLVMVLKKNEWLFQSVIWPNMKDWRNESLESIFATTNLYGGFMFRFHEAVEVMKKDVSNFDLSKAIQHINLFDFKDNPILQSGTRAMSEVDKAGFTQKVMDIWFVSQQKEPIASFKNGGYRGFESTLTPEEMWFMERLFKYAEDIMPTMYSILDQNSKTALGQMFKTESKSPRLGQIMALYILTWGKTKLGEMNTAEKTALSIAPLKFATANDDGMVFSTLIQYYSGLLLDWPSFIPQEVQEVLWITFREVKNATLHKLWEYAGWTESAVLKYMTDNPAEAAVLIASFAVGGYWVLWLWLRAGKFVVGGLAAAIAAKLAFGANGK